MAGPRQTSFARILVTLGAAAAASFALAQETPPPSGPPRPAPLLSVDYAVATINDAVVLYSELMAATVGEIKTQEQLLGRKLTTPERQILFNNNLRREIEQQALAQGAKTFGIVPPERIEQVVTSLLEDDERERIRQLGSLQKLSEERARLNQTWQTYYREERVKKLAAIARQMGVYDRLQNQRHLFITPRMMREFYRANREAYVHEGRATVGIVAFTGRDQDAARAAAQEAAKLWREEPLTTAEIAARFADRGAFMLREFTTITERSRKDEADPTLVDFALAGPAMTVSDPVVSGGAVQVRKIFQHMPASTGNFEDPQVQASIRQQLEQAVERNLLQQTTRRAMERTEVKLFPGIDLPVR